MDVAGITGQIDAHVHCGIRGWENMPFSHQISLQKFQSGSHLCSGINNTLLNLTPYTLYSKNIIKNTGMLVYINQDIDRKASSGSLVCKFSIFI
jgi:hypothetical protein